jgi:alpha-methylacyl-CoA racemase
LDSSHQTAWRQNKNLPLHGLRVLDFSALGPGPYASRILADHGADVVSVEAPTTDMHDAQRMMGRNKRSIVIDLQKPDGKEIALDLLPKFDVLIESMRPGKMERLGLGPNIALKRNPRLIYARLTAFGQDGPLAQSAGHDINAIAIAGALALVGLDRPIPPAALVGDFGSGALMIVVGILLALYRLQFDGKGTVVDAAMSDGASVLAGGVMPLFNLGEWGPRGTNLIDGSRPFYSTYQCADGKWLAVGAIEPKFFATVIEVLDLSKEIKIEDQFDASKADAMRALIAARVATRTRDEWALLFEHRDGCVHPVLELEELAEHPHHQARKSVYADNGAIFSGTAPRLSGFDLVTSGWSPKKGEHTIDVLREADIDESRIRNALTSAALFTSE